MASRRGGRDTTRTIRHLLGQIAQICRQMYSVFGLLGMAAGLTGQLFQVLATCI